MPVTFPRTSFHWNAELLETEGIVENLLPRTEIVSDRLRSRTGEWNAARASETEQPLARLALHRLGARNFEATLRSYKYNVKSPSARRFAHLRPCYQPNKLTLFSNNFPTALNDAKSRLVRTRSCLYSFSSGVPHRSVDDIVAKSHRRITTIRARVERQQNVLRAFQ